MTDPINPKLVEIALDHAEGIPFEQFGHSFYSAIFGSEFVPLGGIHDGGADGFVALSLYEVKGTGSFAIHMRYFL